jgi:hypothetical protein
MTFSGMCRQQPTAPTTVPFTALPRTARLLATLLFCLHTSMMKQDFYDILWHVPATKSVVDWRDTPVNF